MIYKLRRRPRIIRCRFFLCGVVLVLFAVFCSDDIAVANHPVIQAEAYIVVDALRGTVLKEKRSHIPNPPASMTKMMTGLLVLDRIKEGKIHFSDPVSIGIGPAAVTEVGVGLKKGDQLSVLTLLQAVFIYSANDAAIALSEYIAGSEESFVKMMNQKAVALGMTRTCYVDATGLSSTGRMSAYDTAVLCRELLRAHPDILRITSQTEVKVQGKVYMARNKMLKGKSIGYPGVDGMKTGHTNQAGYCFTSTALKDKLRLITVVMGTPTEKSRFTETKKLLDLCFREYKMRTFGIQDLDKKRLPVINGTEDSVSVQLFAPVVMVVKRNAVGYSFRVFSKEGIKAPLKKGELVGHAQVLFKGLGAKGIKAVPLYAASDIGEINWIQKIVKAIQKVLKFLLRLI